MHPTKKVTNMHPTKSGEGGGILNPGVADVSP